MEKKEEQMSLREEKIEQSLNELMLTVQDVNLDLSELQERASLNNSAVVDDYENITDQIKNIEKEICELEYKFDITEISLYLIFLDLKLSFNILKNKLEITKYLIELFKRQ
ncbi:hypothetical protein S100390_v1c03710 [Spiroplasma sp. NBRC 100390]|uniref:hypothetical protein n=1 Tax=unclassified Spiroplasma TaxID=2637901 RepID=UPI000892A2E9|nr:MULTISPECIES: hypothetical protein [unclassified Spiroplasma]AOX43714.1 hypothetical protein STU14_v1c03710 [Spiroplasma sp. TU-14]APE13184.1 hypothetical protein S100390_v1c03710 [Spiroplasma sp. NBRC 100390]